MSPYHERIRCPHVSVSLHTGMTNMAAQIRPRPRLSTGNKLTCLAPKPRLYVQGRCHRLPEHRQGE